MGGREGEGVLGGRARGREGEREGEREEGRGRGGERVEGERARGRGFGVVVSSMEFMGCGSHSTSHILQVCQR